MLRTYLCVAITTALSDGKTLYSAHFQKVSEVTPSDDQPLLNIDTDEPFFELGKRYELRMLAVPGQNPASVTA